MEFAFKRALARRGAVFYLPSVEFEAKTKGKYCVLMEEYTDGAETLIVVFTTHRTDFAYRRTSVLVEDSAFDGIDGDTVIQCENWREIPADLIVHDRRSKWVGNLSPEITAMVDGALAYVRNIDEATLIRMLR